MPHLSCTALITGFGPFPGVEFNISATLAERVGQSIQRRFPSSRVITAALPTEWDIAPERTSDLILEHQPTVAVHFGVSDIAQGFVVETIARNATARADAAGIEPTTSEIEPFGPDTIATQLPAARIDARLKRLGLPSRLSRDAGTYLCNAVFYRSLLTQSELGQGGRSGFIHLPVSVRQPNSPVRDLAAPINFEGALRGGIEVISACLSQ